MMHPRLLEYFSEELLYMREGAVEFARAHPGVASHLGIGAQEIADPYVERLIEAFCLLSARVRVKLDAEFPRFSQRLLEVLHPHFLAPIPAMGIATLEARDTDPSLAGGRLVPAGTGMAATLDEHPDTPIEWRSTRDVVLWPLRIVEACLDPGVPDLGRISSGWNGRGQAHACLRLRVQVLSGHRVRDLRGLDSLRIHLVGDLPMASRLFEVLHRSFVGCVVVPSRCPQEARLVPGQTLVYEGMQPGEGMLPLRYNASHPHNLLQEYFHAPQCLQEFTLRGLGPALQGLDGQAFELWLLVGDAAPDLCAWVNASCLDLFCTPVINLFEARTDRLQLQPERYEYQVVVDRARPLDHEVWSVEEMHAHRRDGIEPLCFRPLYRTIHRDGGDHGRYFAQRRVPRVPSGAARRWGTRSPYVGTEVYVSLVDQFDAPAPLDLQQMSVRAWLTNRDLPLWLGRATDSGRSLSVRAAVAGGRLLRSPSPPRSPLAADGGAWSFVRLLGMHHLPLVELDASQGAHALRELLTLFASAGDTDAARRIESLQAARVRCTTRRLPCAGPQVFGPTLECEVELDEQAFAPGSPLLFGMVLERVLAHYVAINTCSRMELHSTQRGAIWSGPMRMGSRGVV